MLRKKYIQLLETELQFTVNSWLIFRDQNDIEFLQLMADEFHRTYRTANGFDLLEIGNQAHEVALLLNHLIDRKKINKNDCSISDEIYNSIRREMEKLRSMIAISAGSDKSVKGP